MVNPGNVRKLNALGGKRPQATGIVLIPKNGDRKLATTNGSTSNYGGNTKFGLFPNVGMKYLFQNKFGVGSLFNAQVDPGIFHDPGDTTTPTIDTSNLLPTISAGSQVLGSVSANETVTWSIISGGSDKSIDSSTGVVTLDSGATTTSGVVDYIIRATDGNNNTTDTMGLEAKVLDWSQVGPDFNGEAAGDEAGYSVSLSSDGTTVAIAAHQNDAGNGINDDRGNVKVYRRLGGGWSQLGADIDGEAIGDYSGSAVSLSNDGSIVAIGAINALGVNALGASTGTSGHVRVYEYKIPTQNEWDNENVIKGVDAGNPNPTSGTKYWSQLGSDIDGEASGDYSGYSVSLSSDGTWVAIGAIYNAGNGSNSGHVRVYRNYNGGWNKIGNDIDGDATDDYSGWSVSLSSDGTTVAIGATEVSGTGSGYVRVYEVVIINGILSWSQLGADIDGEATDDWSGYSVSLSNYGKIVAIGAIHNDSVNGTDSGHVRVYEYKIPTQNEWDNGNVIKGGDAGNPNPTSGTKYWSQLGSDIDGEGSGDYSGYSVSLSSDGSIVAIGAIENGGGTDSGGHVKVYEYSSGSWTQKGPDIDGEATGDWSGYSVSLSGDGQFVAIGAPLNDAGNTDATDNRGQVKVYEFQVV